ncbi:MAG: 30S ribosomal protein S17 [Phycisphaerales bacterium]|nr:MAG: 30S ribosomal protein S17 [Phycisphaerales bacterium]
MAPTETGNDAGNAKAAVRRHRATRQGVVTSDKGDKTIVVACEHLTQHRKYGKYMLRRTKLHVHDEKNEAKVGDHVEVMATRPISKTKAWRLIKVL